MDEVIPSEFPYKKNITFVKDRAGHDKRYSINASKIKNELGWEINYKFLDALKLTINWYIKNKSWLNK